MATPSKPETKAKGKSKAPGTAIPDLKTMMNFFHATPKLQILYAQHMKSTLDMFIGGTITSYPHDLNTPRDIIDFVSKHRDFKIGAAESSLAIAFFDMHIQAAQTGKRRNEEDHQAGVKTVKAAEVPKPSPRKIKDTPVPKQGSSGFQYPELRTMPKRKCELAMASIPTSLEYFPAPKASVFSSSGGLHDSSCDLCYTVGFYNIHGKKRSLSLIQKRWVQTLHAEISDDGKTIGDVNALREVSSRFKPRKAASDTSVVSWADEMEMASA